MEKPIVYNAIECKECNVPKGWGHEIIFENNDLLGEASDQRYTVADIQMNASPAFGFGLIGSYAGTDGTKSNFFFSRVDPTGNFISNTINLPSRNEDIYIILSIVWNILWKIPSFI